MLFISSNKKSQVWYVDFIIGIIVFISVLSIYSSYTNLSEENSLLEDVVSDARAVSSYLAGVGYPVNWSSSDVTILGLSDANGRVTPDKLTILESVDYSNARSLLNTKYNFFIYFTDKNGCLLKFPSGNYGYGHPDAELEDTEDATPCNFDDATRMELNLSQLSPKDVVRIERIVIYNSTASRMILHEWS